MEKFNTPKLQLFLQDFFFLCPMSSVPSRSISRSTSTRSSSTTKRLKPNYRQIANELIEGSPTQSVSKRDLNQVLLNLAILRSEATAVEDYGKADHIAEIIKDLNKRIIPPPIRQKSTTGLKSPTSKGSDQFSESTNDQMVEPISQRITELPDAEFYNISVNIDYLIDSDDKTLRNILKLFDDIDFSKYYFVIKTRKEICIDNSNYDELRCLDELYDKIKKEKVKFDQQKFAFRDHDSKARIQELQDKIERCKLEIERINEEKEERLMPLRQQKEEEIQALKEAHEKEIQEYIDNTPTYEDAVVAHPSLALKEMRINERRYAKARDYEAAKLTHRDAELKEAEEKNEIFRKNLEAYAKKKDLLLQKQQQELQMKEKWKDALILKTQKEFDKSIENNNAAIELAEREIAELQKKKPVFTSSMIDTSS